MSQQPVVGGYLGANGLWYMTRRSAATAGTPVVASYTAKGPVEALARSRQQQLAANPPGQRQTAPASQNGQLYRRLQGGYVPTVDLQESIFESDEKVQVAKRYGFFGKSKNDVHVPGGGRDTSLNASATLVFQNPLAPNRDLYTWVHRHHGGLTFPITAHDDPDIQAPQRVVRFHAVDEADGLGKWFFIDDADNVFEGRAPETARVELYRAVRGRDGRDTQGPPASLVWEPAAEAVEEQAAQLEYDEAERKRRWEEEGIEVGEGVKGGGPGEYQDALTGVNRSFDTSGFGPVRQGGYLRFRAPRGSRWYGSDHDDMDDDELAADPGGTEAERLYDIIPADVGISFVATKPGDPTVPQPSQVIEFHVLDFDIYTGTWEKVAYYIDDTNNIFRRVPQETTVVSARRTAQPRKASWSQPTIITPGSRRGSSSRRASSGSLWGSPRAADGSDSGSGRRRFSGPRLPNVGDEGQSGASESTGEYMQRMLAAGSGSPSEKSSDQQLSGQPASANDNGKGKAVLRRVSLGSSSSRRAKRPSPADDSPSPASKKQKTQQPMAPPQQTHTTDTVAPSPIAAPEPQSTVSNPLGIVRQQAQQTDLTAEQSKPTIPQPPQRPQPPPSPNTDGLGPIRGDPKLYPPSAALTERQLKRIIAWCNERRRDEDFRLGRTVGQRPPPRPGYYYFVRNPALARPRSPSRYYYEGAKRGAVAGEQARTAIAKRLPLSKRQHNELVQRLDAASQLLKMNASPRVASSPSSSSKSGGSSAAAGQQRNPPTRQVGSRLSPLLLEKGAAQQSTEKGSSSNQAPKSGTAQPTAAAAAAAAAAAGHSQSRNRHWDDLPTDGDADGDEPTASKSPVASDPPPQNRNRHWDDFPSDED